MTKTTNYQLNQWVKSDRLMMDDFNADNQKIDAAIKAVADGTMQFITGSYVGDGAEDRVIDLGVTPKLAIVLGTYSSASSMISLLTPETCCNVVDSANITKTFFALEGSTLHVKNAKYHNRADATIRYILIV